MKKKCFAIKPPYEPVIASPPSFVSLDYKKKVINSIYRPKKRPEAPSRISLNIRMGRKIPAKGKLHINNNLCCDSRLFRSFSIARRSSFPRHINCRSCHSPCCHSCLPSPIWPRHWHRAGPRCRLSYRQTVPTDSALSMPSC